MSDALHAIAYISAATRELQSVEIDGLLLDARGFNAMSGVTGVLLFNGTEFFQYFEGLSVSVNAVYERIRQARSHADIRELLNAPIAIRQFESWHMGFCRPPITALQELAQARWQESLPVTRTSFQRADGVALLVHYWSKWRAAAPFP
ncbi:BLUF domain-containing protein [Lysobacter auxotrophicus]|uniref:BLUF domain-containing protein n=1 Tax=Lysobacter auxotrophicus TaxID=2992573 RepID=A0ABN6UK72_9GAMM|nr:BLUF domain-containing protein [Lysobacter auxotrophicus]BDU16649.1 BLUF domain-containing protein [Lysobacter auxotrophicus]